MKCARRDCRNNDGRLRGYNALCREDVLIEVDDKRCPCYQSISAGQPGDQQRTSRNVTLAPLKNNAYRGTNRVRQGRTRPRLVIASQLFPTLWLPSRLITVPCPAMSSRLLSSVFPTMKYPYVHPEETPPPLTVPNKISKCVSPAAHALYIGKS